MLLKRVDEYVERAWSYFFVLPPDSFDQPASGYNARGVLCQQFQEQVLGPSQVDGLALTSDVMPDRIHNQVRDGEGGWRWFRCRTSNGAKARQQLRKGERLGQVIVGAEIKSANDFVLFVVRRQHKNRSWVFPFLEHLRDIIAAQTGKTQVEQNDVEISV